MALSYISGPMHVSAPPAINLCGMGKSVWPSRYVATANEAAGRQARLIYAPVRMYRGLWLYIGSCACVYMSAAISL